ncbi:hypothetical protein HHK36_005824 [Tetracentron sinense]|uniref:RIN4 pathogenic type III effector avirulence factor Avr cleavage site domain-containing protein n=1 Tax=Tetracentron sinense TaxID=13715 RepID=A0A834ZLS9_TETSI|nr:hypothetical protein HHK36_005824 [Tetracentron sinense]
MSVSAHYKGNRNQQEKATAFKTESSSFNGGITGFSMYWDKGRPLPKFGEWDVNDPASAEGFTVLFNKARDEKKTGGQPDSPGKDDTTLKHGTDPGKPQAELAADMENIKVSKMWCVLGFRSLLQIWKTKSGFAAFNLLPLNPDEEALPQ